MRDPLLPNLTLIWPNQIRRPSPFFTQTPNPHFHTNPLKTPANIPLHDLRSIWLTKEE